MTDAQFGILLSAAGVIFTGFGKLAWSMFQAWLKERAEDRSTAKEERVADRTERREDRAANLETARDITAALVKMSERVSSLERVFDRNDSRISGVHDVPESEEPAPRTRTPAAGIPRVSDRPYDRNRDR